MSPCFLKLLEVVKPLMEVAKSSRHVLVRDSGTFLGSSSGEEVLW